MQNNYSLIVSSCDGYSDVWNPFFTLLKKYWPTINCPIYLCTDNKKYSFEGLDIICPLNNNKQNTWSENLIELLNIIKTDYVLFLLDDFWIKEPVNDLILNKCIEYFDSDSNIGCFCLRPNEPGPFRNSKKYAEFLIRKKNAPYRITTQVSIWRKQYLLKILRKHENAWQFEVYGTIRSKFYNEDLYLIKPNIYSPFSYHSGGVVYRGKYIKSYIKDFEDEFITIDLSRGVEELEVMREKVTKIKANRMSFKYWVTLYKSFSRL